MAANGRSDVARRWWAVVLMVGALTGSMPAGQAPPTYRFRSGPMSELELPCDISVLNREYLLALNYKRQQRQPGASLARLDPNLLPGTFLHAYEMEQRDSIYHDMNSFSYAEMCGSMVDMASYRGKPRELARYIWTRFHNSPPHDALQRDSTLRFVSVSCLNDFFVVRLTHSPCAPNREQMARFRKTLLPIQLYTERRRGALAR